MRAGSNDRLHRLDSGLRVKRRYNSLTHTHLIGKAHTIRQQNTGSINSSNRFPRLIHSCRPITRWDLCEDSRCSCPGLSLALDSCISDTLSFRSSFCARKEAADISHSARNSHSLTRTDSPHPCTRPTDHVGTLVSGWRGTRTSSIRTLEPPIPLLDCNRRDARESLFLAKGM